MKRLLILPIVSFFGAAAFCFGMFSTADEDAPAPDASIIDNTPRSTDGQIDENLQYYSTAGTPVITPAPTEPVVSEPDEAPEETSLTIRYTTPNRWEGATFVPDIDVIEPLETTVSVTTTVPVTTTAPVTTTKATTKVTTTKKPDTTKAPEVIIPETGVAESAAEIVRIAISQIGVKEKATNNVKYNTWYYGGKVSGSSYAWCGVFISWCADQAGIPQSVIPKSASSNYFCNWYKDRGLYTKYSSSYVPKVGDLIFIDWGGGRSSIDHVGIVVAVEDGIVTTVEGNYGNKVACNTYALNDRDIVGYASPKYS